jgi:hypothetical protein
MRSVSHERKLVLPGTSYLFGSLNGAVVIWILDTRVLQNLELVSIVSNESKIKNHELPGV